MKNWKYIEGAKTGNGILDIFKSEKPIKMKSSKGAIVTIHPDGSAAHQEKEGSQMAVHHYNSFKEAVEYYKNQGYVKVGNDTPAEYDHRKPKVVNDDKTGAEEFFKQLSDDVKEREKKDDEEIKLVGNETYQHKLYPDKYVIIEGNNYKIVTDGKVEKSGKITDAVLYGINQTYKRVGNSKWELPDGSTATVEDDGTIKIKKPRDSSIYITKLWDKERAEKQLAQKGAKKVGNSKTGNAKDKNDKDLKVGDIVDVRGKKGKITKIIGDVIEVFYDNSGTYNPDRIDRHYADEAKKVGNSASDDKFAYVMREFDEGKLKTPDGKVVTDPAQAKAIAYSESKKTENGLARARKAIK